MNTTPTPGMPVESPTLIRRLVPATVAAAALAAMILTAPVAYAADAEQQVKDDCAAQGGEYATHVAANGNRVSQCCIRTNQGLKTVHHLMCSYYVNGEYDGSGLYAPAPPDTTVPGPPPERVNPVPPGANQGPPDTGNPASAGGTPVEPPTNNPGTGPSGGLQ
jgi:hypothetical protein